jgi:hypothetical protein
MLFPEDPNKRPALWASVREKLASGPYCYAVENGTGKRDCAPTVKSAEEAAEFVDRLRAADICRISASHGTAVGPHFALRWAADTDEARLVEFVALPGSDSIAADEWLKRQLETMVVSVMYEFPPIRRILIPISIEPWAMPDVDIRPTRTGLEIAKREKSAP